MACALLCCAQLRLALAPYTHADKLATADLPSQLAQVEKKLQAEGFTVLGHHMPKGIADQASVVISDPALLEIIRASGTSSAIIASGLRVGIAGDGHVSYMTPDYWYRAYLHKQFSGAQEAVKSIQMRLTKALGEGASQRVYEVLMPAQKMAAFGVTMNRGSDGESWWVNKIGTDFPAALPYELFIVDNNVYALYARYRIALAWPALGMGQFMGIIHAPEAIRNTMLRLVSSVASGS